MSVSQDHTGQHDLEGFHFADPVLSPGHGEQTFRSGGTSGAGGDCGPRGDSRSARRKGEVAMAF